MKRIHLFLYLQVILMTPQDGNKIHTTTYFLFLLFTQFQKEFSM